jgi:hypothetical protein
VKIKKAEYKKEKPEKKVLKERLLSYKKRELKIKKKNESRR